MYNFDEKRIKDLYGEKQKPEYTIKLNNEFLDSDDQPRDLEKQSPLGTLKQGNALA